MIDKARTIKPSVMIVEADILVRHPLAEFLRDCGYRVVEASDADEAHRLLNGKSAPIDIVLADANTAGEGGFALARWIRGKNPKIEVMLAGSVARAAEKAGELCDEGPGLSKPYNHKLVLERIQRFVAARDRRPRG
jgi:DNA-binding response OmpR family regulator